MSTWRARAADCLPRDWKLLAIAGLCLAVGWWNVQIDTWYYHVAALWAGVGAGFSLFSSIWIPHYKELQRGFVEQRQRLESHSPEAMAKQASEAFVREVLAMQARGELPPNCQIVIEDTTNKPPPGRLN